MIATKTAVTKCQMRIMAKNKMHQIQVRLRRLQPTIPRLSNRNEKEMEEEGKGTEGKGG